MTYGPLIGSNNFEDFGYSDNLSNTLNSIFEFDNLGGFSTITFKLVIPTGGKVIFEGNFDTNDYLPVTMRGITTDGYLQTSSSSQSYIGSIIGLKKFRIRVTQAGSTVGTVTGRAQRDVSVLEGIEHGHPPHKFGYLPVHKAVEYTTAQTDAIIWTPTSGRKFIITDYTIIVIGNIDTTLTIFDQTNSQANWLFRSKIDLIANSPNIIVSNLRTPFVSSTVNNSLKVTFTGSNIEAYIMLYGYEAEN